MALTVKLREPGVAIETIEDHRRGEVRSAAYRSDQGKRKCDGDAQLPAHPGVQSPSCDDTPKVAHGARSLTTCFAAKATINFTMNLYRNAGVRRTTCEL